MTPEQIQHLSESTRQDLLEDVVPFWLRHSLDRECGGYLHCLDRDGSVYGTDKSMWVQCRAVWLYSRLYRTIEARPEWLDAARLGFDFATRYGFDSDGRMFFHVTRDGRPLRKRRYLFTEAFGVLACAEYGRAAADDRALQRAWDTFRLMVDLLRTPGALPPKIIPETRVTKSHAVPMILLAITQELREFGSDPLATEIAEEAVDQIVHHFLKRDERALLETVGPQGERLDSPEGRCMNPGHAIESAWFLMHEARRQNDSALLRTALDILDWSLERGWDPVHGGLFYFIDIEDKPPQQLEWDMKLWWPHTEALYAVLLAHHLTGMQTYADWYEKVRRWAHDHFPDRDFGEWYGYLHRDGSIALRLKGSMWKGPFHLPRAQLLTLRVLEEMQASS